jgi:GNAT superfamily N-acetyltransferase
VGVWVLKYFGKLLTSGTRKRYTEPKGAMSGEKPHVKKPDKCTAQELYAFGEIVRLGDEVQSAGLELRIKRAHRLAFVTSRSDWLGVAALKRPSSEYRKSVQRGSGTTLNPDRYPFELGWIFVASEARRRGIARMLIAELLRSAREYGIFATARSNNSAIHCALEQAGFRAAGAEYQSSRGAYRLRLFILDPKPGRSTDAD